MTYMKWSADLLDRIVQADDLKVSPLRADLATYGTPTWIWCVAVDGDLYVRAYSGKGSRWYGAALQSPEGRIVAAGQALDVTFTPVEGPINAKIDLAYARKYKSSRYLAPMVGAPARAATMRIDPRA